MENFKIHAINITSVYVMCEIIYNTGRFDLWILGCLFMWSITVNSIVLCGFKEIEATPIQSVKLVLGRSFINVASFVAILFTAGMILQNDLAFFMPFIVTLGLCAYGLVTGSSTFSDPRRIWKELNQG